MTIADAINLQEGDTLSLQGSKEFVVVAGRPIQCSAGMESWVQVPCLFLSGDVVGVRHNLLEKAKEKP